jgi:hypothetical protein
MHPVRNGIGFHEVAVWCSSFIGLNSALGISGYAQFTLIGLVRIHHDVIVQHKNIYFESNAIG